MNSVLTQALYCKSHIVYDEPPPPNIRRYDEGENNLLCVVNIFIQ